MCLWCQAAQGKSSAEPAGHWPRVDQSVSSRQLSRYSAISLRNLGASLASGRAAAAGDLVRLPCSVRMSLAGHASLAGEVRRRRGRMSWCGQLSRRCGGLLCAGRGVITAGTGRDLLVIIGRGIVFGSRGAPAGHAFNGVNQGGTIRFLDGQSRSEHRSRATTGLCF